MLVDTSIGAEKDFQIFISKEGSVTGTFEESRSYHSESGESLLVERQPEEPVTMATDANVNANSTVNNSNANADCNANTSTPQGPINEETGEINWDCPCLKGALEPPCGDYFKSAFSCFVASQSEPKGSECLELFAAMQDCFRAHPDVYLRDDDGNNQDDGSPGEEAFRSAEEQLVDTPDSTSSL